MEWLDRVLANPEKIESDKEDPDVKHALGRIPEHGSRVLRVVYNGAVKPGVILDFNEHNQVVGVEILNAGKRVSEASLKQMHFEVA